MKDKKSEISQKAAIAKSQLLRTKTIEGRKSAMNVFHSYMADMNVDVIAIAALDAAKNDCETRTEIVLEVLLDFSFWLKQNAVQAKGRNKALNSSTIGQYYGQVKETIRDYTFDLKFWEHHHNEQWYTELLNIEQCERCAF